MNIDNIKNYLQEHLSEFRYSHSLRVAEEAKKIAKRYCIDEENLFWIKKYNLPEECLSESYKNILHSDIGALIARDFFFFDNSMCQAIKYHTIGNINMNTFDKVIFIADKIGRKNLNSCMKKVKKLVYQGHLDQAIIIYLENLNDNLKLKKVSMHPNSLKLIHLLQNNITK